MVLLLWVKGGKHYTISVPANSNNAYLMKNDEWSLQVNIKKTDSETGNQIAADAQYEIFQWDTVTGKYQPTGGYNTYSVQRQGDGTYAVINSAAYVTTDSMRHTLYYTQRNTGKFIIVESKAPTGYFGDWTDINHPGMANTPLGKRGYYIEITEDSDNSVIWLDNADYNADIAATDKGGTKLVTSTGVETTVTIYDTAKDPRRTYNTDNSGKAANEDSYTITPSDGVMKNDRTLGEISISKVDLDAVRYVGGSTAHGTALASGQAHGDAALDGAVYDLYAAEDITHPDGVTGVVDYSKIVDADGNPIWHTTIRDNSGQWVSDYLPVLKKDHLVASAKIENGWLCFSNLYLGKYYVVERSTGVVIPLRDGALVVSSTYPTVDSRTKAATGQTAALAKNGSGQYTDWVYKNQFSTVSKGKALDGSWTYDAYYLSFADGYLVDEHITSGNAALVLQTLPQARAVLTAKDWDKFGRRVNKGAKGIPQLVRVNGYYNVGSIFDVSMTYGNKPYPIPEIKPEQMDKAIKELERLSPVNIIFQNEGVVGYDAEQHAIVFPTAMPQREVLARLPAEIVIATAEQHTPGISQAPYLRKTAMAVSVEFCGRFSLPMPDTAAATLDGMDTHIPPGEERKTLEEIRELSVTIGDTVEKALGLQRGQSSPQRDEAR